MPAPSFASTAAPALGAGGSSLSSGALRAVAGRFGAALYHSPLVESSTRTRRLRPPRRSLRHEGRRNLEPWYPLISYVKLWYHIIHYYIIGMDIWYHSTGSMISCIWYHTTMISYSMSYDIIVRYMISCIWYHIEATWYHMSMISCIWYHMKIHTISYVMTYDIIYIWYHIWCILYHIYDIMCMVPWDHGSVCMISYVS